jgi:hypothetical protein
MHFVMLVVYAATAVVAYVQTGNISTDVASLRVSLSASAPASRQVSPKLAALPLILLATARPRITDYLCHCAAMHDSNLHNYRDPVYVLFAPW